MDGEEKGKADSLPNAVRQRTGGNDVLRFLTKSNY